MKSGEFPELEKGWKTPVSEVLREDFVLEDPYRTVSIFLLAVYFLLRKGWLLVVLGRGEDSIYS